MRLNAQPVPLETLFPPPPYDRNPAHVLDAANRTPALRRDVVRVVKVVLLIAALVFGLGTLLTLPGGVR